VAPCLEPRSKSLDLLRRHETPLQRLYQRFLVPAKLVCAFLLVWRERAVDQATDG
jgi:hypothetical protein